MRRPFVDSILIFSHRLEEYVKNPLEMIEFGILFDGTSLFSNDPKELNEDRLSGSQIEGQDSRCLDSRSDNSSSSHSSQIGWAGDGKR